MVSPRERCARRARRAAGQLPNPQRPGVGPASGPPGHGLPALPLWVYPVAAVVLAVLAALLNMGSMDDELITAQRYCDVYGAADPASCPATLTDAPAAPAVPASAP